MHVRRHEAGLYEMTNRAKGSTYHVRFDRVGGKVFGTCAGEVEVPHKRDRVPMRAS